MRSSSIGGMAVEMGIPHSLMGAAARHGPIGRTTPSACGMPSTGVRSLAPTVHYPMTTSNGGSRL